MKIGLSKTKTLIWKFIPIAHSIIYHHQKVKKYFFTMQKSFRVLNLSRVLIIKFPLRSSVGSFLGSSRTTLSLGPLMIVFYRVLSDRVFFRALSGQVVFNASLISFVLFYIIFIKTSSDLTITFINNLNKTDR